MLLKLFLCLCPFFQHTTETIIKLIHNAPKGCIIEKGYDKSDSIGSILHSILHGNPCNTISHTPTIDQSPRARSTTETPAKT